MKHCVWNLFHLIPFQLCGMCGNYNHNSSDDNLMPNKKPAKDVIELGNSWKSDGDSDPGSVGYNHNSWFTMIIWKSWGLSHKTQCQGSLIIYCEHLYLIHWLNLWNQGFLIWQLCGSSVLASLPCISFSHPTWDMVSCEEETWMTDMRGHIMKSTHSLLLAPLQMCWVHDSIN